MEISGYDGLVEIGRGGSGVVYRATQVAFDRTVAIKVLHAAGIDPDARRRFERECRSIGNLSWHPHVLAVHDAGFTPNGDPYLAMEHLPAGSLAARATHDRPLPEPDAVAVTIQVADALVAAHAAGVIHRDVKPGNILVGHFGDAKLADFGIAALTSANTSVTHSMAGTLSYMAPELLEGEPATEASDVYALGATLHTLLVGHAPFASTTDASPLAVVRRIATEPAPDLTANGVSPDLAAVVRRALAHDTADRYATARDLLDALATVNRSHGWPAVRTYSTTITGGRPDPHALAVGARNGGGMGEGEGDVEPASPADDPTATIERTPHLLGTAVTNAAEANDIRSDDDPAATIEADDEPTVVRPPRPPGTAPEPTPAPAPTPQVVVDVFDGQRASDADVATFTPARPNDPPGGDEPPNGQGADDEPGPSRSRRRWFAIALGAATVIIGAVLAVVVAKARSDDGPTSAVATTSTTVAATTVASTTTTDPPPLPAPWNENPPVPETGVNELIVIQSRFTNPIPEEPTTGCRPIGVAGWIWADPAKDAEFYDSLWSWGIITADLSQTEIDPGPGILYSFDDGSVVTTMPNGFMLSMQSALGDYVCHYDFRDEDLTLSDAQVLESLRWIEGH